MGALFHCTKADAITLLYCLNLKINLHFFIWMNLNELFFFVNFLEEFFPLLLLVLMSVFLNLFIL